MFPGLSISGDGSRIVFEHSGDLTGSNPHGLVQVFAVNADGTGLRQMTTFGTDAWRPEISGDGTKVVFDSLADPLGKNPYFRNQVFIIDWEGTGLDQITECLYVGPCSNAGRPHITDDAQVVFYADRVVEATVEDNYEIWRMNADGTGKTQLTITSPPVVNMMETISGSGNLVAFASTGEFPGGDNPDRNDELISMTSTGTDIRQLSISSDGGNSYPDITPDGSRIAFVSNGNLLGTDPEWNNELYRVESDGSGLFQVTDFNSGSVWDPSITADGGIIAFSWSTGKDGSGQYLVYSVRADGTDLRPLIPYPAPGPVGTDIASDGSWIIFTDVEDRTGQNSDHSSEVFRVRPDGTGLSQVTDDPDTSYLLPRIDDNGVWVVYMTCGDPLGTNDDGSYEIYRVRSDGTGYETITENLYLNSMEPDISGSGDRIVYVSEGDPLGTNGDFSRELFLYEPGTGTKTQLTDTTDGEFHRPRFSRDGSWVYFTSTVDFFGNSLWCQAYRLEIATGAIERVGGLEGSFCSTDWRNNPALAVDATGDSAVFGAFWSWTGTNMDRSNEIWLADQDEPAHIYIGKESPTVVTWDAEPKPYRYDVVRGDVASLGMLAETVDLGPVECIENDSDDTTTAGFEDAVDPDPGQVFFYLHRGSQGTLDGPGNYGAGSGGSERIAGSGDCSI
jgi:Tol biopolymer transport system component